MTMAAREGDRPGSSTQPGRPGGNSKEPPALRIPGVVGLTLADAAVTCAQAGLKVFPVAVGGKEPALGKGGYHKATADVEKVREWWSRHPEFNIGLPMAPNGLVCVDVDSAEKVAFLEGRVLPATYTQNTVQGRHYVYRVPDGVTGFVGKIGDDVDIKHNGYIVLAPSVHPSGARYTVADRRQPVELPKRLLAHLQERRSATSPSAGVDALMERPHVAAVLAGDLRDRSKALFSLAGAVHDDGGAFRHYAAITQAHPGLCSKLNGRDAEAYLRDCWDKTYEERQDTRHTAEAFLGTPDEIKEASDDLMDVIFDLDVLAQMPQPTPLVEGILYQNSLAWLGGAPGHGKSFLALDIAVSVGAGLPWHERAVARGPVLYIAAEGASGMAARAEAACTARGIAGAPGVLFLPLALPVLDREAHSKLTGAVDRIEPVLIILDTQARMTVGAEENSAKEMGALVRALDALRMVNGACVLTLHHTPRNGSNLRGSTALEGAADTVLMAEKDGRVVSLTSVKQKSIECAPTVQMVLTGSDNGSAYMDHDPMSPIVTDSASEEAILDAVVSLIELRREPYSTAVQEESGLTPPTYKRALFSLVSKGAVTKEKRGRHTVIGVVGH